MPGSEQIELWASRALQGRREEAELSVRIVDEDESQELNSQYRHKDKPTNVLSFPADLPPELELPLLGDLVICAPVVAREAAEQNKTLAAHWAHMVVHGTLHLLGYDHGEPDEEREMFALQRRLLEEWVADQVEAYQHERQEERDRRLLDKSRYFEN